jgi:hypothetical protein
MSPVLILVALLAAVVGYPLLVLAHELGHALVVLAYGRSAEIAAGDGEHGVGFRAGRLTVSIAVLERGGYCAYDSNGLTIRRRKRVLLGGPIASVVVSAALALSAYLVADADSPLVGLLALGAGVAAIQAGHAAWPRKRNPGKSLERSDGAQLRRLRSFEPHYVPPTREGGRRAICKLFS